MSELVIKRRVGGLESPPSHFFIDGHEIKVRRLTIYKAGVLKENQQPWLMGRTNYEYTIDRKWDFKKHRRREWISRNPIASITMVIFEYKHCGTVIYEAVYDNQSFCYIKSSGWLILPYDDLKLTPREETLLRGYKIHITEHHTNGYGLVLTGPTTTEDNLAMKEQAKTKFRRVARLRIAENQLSKKLAAAYEDYCLVDPDGLIQKDYEKACALTRGGEED